MVTPFQIVTNHCMRRPLGIEDVNECDLSWLINQVALEYIPSTESQIDIGAFRQYIDAYSGRKDVVFLGIFDKDTKKHIGNIKYEPVNSELS